MTFENIFIVKKVTFIGLNLVFITRKLFLKLATGQKNLRKLTSKGKTVARCLTSPGTWSASSLAAAQRRPTERRTKKFWKIQSMGLRVTMFSFWVINSLAFMVNLFTFRVINSLAFMIVIVIIKTI